MESEHSKVELRIGQSEISLTGSEEFISEELNMILDKIDLHADQPLPRADGAMSPVNVQKPSNEESGGVQKDKEGGIVTSDYTAQIQAVANKLNVKAHQIGEHFYVEDENIHLHDSYSTPPKYALIGYCLLKEEFTGEKIFDNAETKKKLIDNMRVPIDDWGSTFLYNLRGENIIKNDPDSDRKRSVPFKITPTAERNFRDWLINDEDD